MMLRSGMTRQYTEKADNEVANDDCYHALPDIEPQCYDGGTSCPAADVERTCDDPECYKVPWAISPA